MMGGVMVLLQKVHVPHSPYRRFPVSVALRSIASETPIGFTGASPAGGLPCAVPRGSLMRFEQEGSVSFPSLS